MRLRVDVDVCVVDRSAVVVVSVRGVLVELGDVRFVGGIVVFNVFI